MQRCAASVDRRQRAAVAATVALGHTAAREGGAHRCRQLRWRMSQALVVTASPQSVPARGERPSGPRVDFEEIAEALDAEVAHPDPREGITAWMGSRVLRGGDWRHAWHVRRQPTGLFLSLTEQIGLPLAFLKPRSARHVLIAHNLTTERRRAFQQRTGYLQRFDRIMVLSRAQEAYLRHEAGVPGDRVRFLFDKVDHRFFAPSSDDDGDGYLLSVGQEQRDYPTFVAAARELGIPTVIVPSSLWNPADGIVRQTLPRNVRIERDLPFTSLRELYDRASLVVVPLRPDVLIAAGVNAVLEAMAMRKPLVVSAIPGLDGYLEDGVTARLVPPADPDALAGAIRELLADRAQARRLAENARRVVEGGRNLDTYVEGVVATTREVLA